MSMKKRLLSGLLALTMTAGLLVTGASAAGFGRSKTYTPGQFTDVKENDWYAASVKDAYELGLMNGSSTTTFSPQGMFTLAEALTIAARMHNIYNGGDGTIPTTSSDWRENGANYCIQKGIIAKGQFDNYARNATRAEMAAIMAAALPDAAWNAINAVSELPDVSGSTDGSGAIFKLYNAGIFTGSDQYGMFQPYAYITRAEVAAIAARCADVSLRKTLSLTPMSQRVAPEIPGGKVTKMSCGLMRFQDQTTKKYGYMDGNGTVKIAAQYSGAEDFSPYGYAVVRLEDGSGLINTNGTVVLSGPSIKEDRFGLFLTKSSVFSDGKYAVVVNGQVKSDYLYYSMMTNGVNIFAKVKDNDWDVFDMSGAKVGHFDGTPTTQDGSPLVAVKSGNKYALANRGTVITDYLYDSIRLYKNESLAVLEYGDQQALAGENGIILGLGEHHFKTDAFSDRTPIAGGYALSIDPSTEEGFRYTCTLADVTGIVAVFNTNEDSIWLNAKNINANGTVMINEYHSEYPWIIDTNTGKVVSPKGSNHRSAKMEDGTFYLPDGTFCQAVNEFKPVSGRSYTSFQVNGKWGLFYDDAVVVEPIYGTEEEALAAYSFIKIAQENGKPVVAYGNDQIGFTDYAIRYYKDSIYYDEIKDMGEGYYACRFNTTWYLVHA